MTKSATILLSIAFLHCCVAVGQSTPPPRASATAYPSSKVQALYSIGARQLSKTEVQNSFATPLAGKYVVVEIGFYPADSKSMSLRQTDFALRAADGKTVVYPARPATIASINQKHPESSNDVSLYPTANVGYVSYPSYDGTGRRSSGVVYGAGVGVGVDKNASAATTDSDRDTMETELYDKELKDAEITKPVAGYLYFPISSKQKGDYQLEYNGTDVASNLPLKSH